MEVDKDDKELIKAIHKQYYLTKDKKIRNGLRYVLKDILGRYLIQIKHYKPYVSKEAEKGIKEKIPNVKISGIELHDCNVKESFLLNEEQRKYFINGNSYDKPFHLEHDPPTLQVVDSILDEESITNEEIAKRLELYRLCFITVEENDKLNGKKFRSKRPLEPPYAYDQCGIIVKEVKEGE
jgi:hypothetical protein